MSDIALNWHVAGLGSIGSLCVATSLKSSTPVTPIVRTGSTSYCTSFTDLSGHVTKLVEPITLESIPEGAINNLLVPVKSYDVIPFLSKVTSKLADKAQVVLCHNGMGTIEQALTLLPHSANLYFCTSSHGVFKQGRQATYAGSGESLWQLIRAGNNKLLSNEQVEAVLPNAKQSEDLPLLLWQKLIINCAINPLTAIHQVKNGELAQTKYQPLINSVVREAVEVAQANGIEIQFASMLDKVYQVIELTGANTSSMLQDVHNKRKTEIDFITGHLINSAPDHVTVKHNQELYNKVVALESV